MTLRSDLSDALKDAMRSKDEAGVSTLRMILAGLKDRDIAARTKGTGEPIAYTVWFHDTTQLSATLRESLAAAEIAGRMARIAPRRTAIWLELARLQETLGSLSAAKASYDTALKSSRAGDPFRNEAALALAALKRRLN